MKLIIEVPECDYNLLKKCNLVLDTQVMFNASSTDRATALSLLNLVEYLKQGKPYEERQQGEWEDYSVNFYKCPECGYLLNKFCPSCYNKVILPKGGADEPQ